MADIFNPSRREVEADETEFEASLCYMSSSRPARDTQALSQIPKEQQRWQIRATLFSKGSTDQMCPDDTPLRQLIGDSSVPSAGLPPREASLQNFLSALPALATVSHCEPPQESIIQESQVEAEMSLRLSFRKCTPHTTASVVGPETSSESMLGCCRA